MSDPLPVVDTKTLETPHGQAIGQSNRWAGGQYCAIQAKNGIIGCGIFDLPTCDEFNLAVAIAKGTPEKPLVYAEDLYEAKIVGVSRRAAELGVREGMTGLEALKYVI
jgi:uncharacterized protein YunC (DUF1805 family)